MAHTRMVETYVGRLVAELTDDAERTENGMFILPLPAGPVVDVVPGPAKTTLRVRVRAAVVHDAEATGEVLAALNDANGRLAYGRLYLDGRTVVVEETIAGAWIELEPLRNAARFVDWAAERFGQELAAAAGGRPALAPDPDGTAEAEAGTGGVTPEGHHGQHAAPGRHPGNTQVALAIDDGPITDVDGTDRTEPGRPAPVNAAGYL